MSTRNERFADAVYSLDLRKYGFGEDRGRRCSDCGEGVYRLIAAIDWDPRKEAAKEAAQLAQRKRLYEAAVEKIAANGLAHFLPVLDEVMENGRQRQVSIVNLCRKMHKKRYAAEKFYYRGVRALLGLFQPMK